MSRARPAVDAPGLSTLPFVLPLCKVDKQTGEFWARAAIEVVDGANEICDYAASRPYFEKLEKRCLAESDGRKVAPLRQMHTPELGAAGLVTAFEYDDAARVVACRGKITDPAALAKAIDGTYCGVSMGGLKRYLGYDPSNPGTRRYAAITKEISLVDLGEIPGSALRMLNASGAGSVEIVDGDDTDLVPFRGLTDRLAKIDAGGLYTAAELAQTIARLKYVRDSAAYEAKAEGDGSTIPGRLDAALATLGELLVDMTREEVTENDDPAPLANAAGATAAESAAPAATATPAATAPTALEEDEMDEVALRKMVGEEIAKALATALGGVPTEATLNKAIGSGLETALGVDGPLNKAIGAAVTPLTEKITSLEGEVAELKKHVAAQPEEPKGALLSLSKAADTDQVARDALGEQALRVLGESDPVALAKLLGKEPGNAFHLDTRGISPL